MKPDLRGKYLKSLVLCLFFVFSIQYGFGQCPVPPTANPVAYLVTGNSNAAFTVGAGQVLVVQSGTYTGSINLNSSTGYIYVASGAVFSPVTISNFYGRLVNCGTANLPGFNFDDPAGLARVENYGNATLTGTYGTNNRNTWINGINATMTMNNGFTIDKTNFLNNGNILMKSSFTINTSGPNTFINHDSITTLGTISLNAAITNDGFLFAKGSNMTLNSQGNITNGCYFIADGSFTYNGSDTLLISGLTWVKGLNGSEFNVQGTALKVIGNGFAQGVNFTNNGNKIFGDGNMYFTGNTANQGGTGNIFGFDGLGLNFYDTGLPGCSGACRLFDNQGGGSVHPNSTRNPVAPKSNTYVPSTCSDLIKTQACKITKGPSGTAGSDFSICSTTADLVDANTAVGQQWSVLTGTASVNSTTGVVTGLSSGGTYSFLMVHPSISTCRDTVTITKACSPVAPDCPKLAIPQEFINARFATPVVTGPVIAGQPTHVRPGGAALYQNIGTVNTGNANVAIDMKVTFVSTNAPGDINGYIQFGLDAPANPTDIKWSLFDWSQGDEHTVKVDFLVSGTNTPATYSGVWNFSDIDSPTATDEIVTMPSDILQNYLISGASNVVVTTSGGNTIFTGTGGANTIQTNPNYAFSAIIENVQGFTMKVQNGGTDTDYYINGNNFNYIPTVNCTKSDQFAVTEDIILTKTAATGVLINDYDPDGDPITVSQVNGTGAVNTNVTLASGAVVNVKADGSFTYNPTVAFNYLNTGQTRVDSFYYQVTDGKGGYDLGTITITITGINDKPNAVDDNKTTNQGIAVIINQNANDTDPEGNLDPTTSVVTINPANGTITKNAGTGVLTYTPNPTFSGKDSLFYKVCDTGTPSLCDTAKIVIIVIKGPSDTVTITGSTVCSIPVNGNATVTIKKAEAGVTYEAYKGAVFLVSGVGNGATDLVLNIAVSSLIAGSNTIKFVAKRAGFLDVPLLKTATVVVNTNPPVSLTVIGDTICSNASSDPTVTVIGAQANVTYEAHLGSATGALLGSTTPILAGNLSITVNRALLAAAPSNNTIYFTATINGCGTQSLNNQANLRVNTNPPVSLIVVGDTICSNASSDPTVTIVGAQANVTYEAHLGSATGAVLGSTTPTSAGNLSITVNRALLAAAPSNNTIYFTATINGCGTQSLNNQANLRVNTNPPVSLAVIGDTICSNASSDPTVTIIGAQANVTYEAHLGSATGALLGSTIPTSAGNLSITVNRALLAAAPSNNAIYFTATINGCGTQSMNNQANLRVNTNPPVSLTVIGDTICSNASSDPTVTVIGAQANVTYEAHLGSATGALLGSTTPTAAGNISIIVNRALLAAAPSNNTIYFTATINGCGTQSLNNQANLRVNTNPQVSLTAIGDTICSNASSDPTVTIVGAQANVTYEAHLGSATGALLGSTTPTSAGNISITVNRALFAAAPSNNTIYFTGTINGCGTQSLNNQANLRVNVNPPLTLTVVGDTICSNSSSDPTVTIIGAQANVTYEAHLGSATGALLGSTTLTGAGNLSITVNRALLAAAPSNNTIFFTATINGCGTQSLNNQANLRVNALPSITSGVSASRLIICAGQKTRISITNTTIGATYTVLDNDTAVGTIISTGLNIDVDVNLNKVGTRTIKVIASNNGCSDVTLTNTATVQVTKGSDISLPVTVVTPICLGDTTTVTVKSSELFVNYQVYDGTTPVPGTVAGTGGDIVFKVSGLTAGYHTIIISANSLGCGALDLVAKPVVVVNAKPLANLSVRGDTLCITSTADSLVTIINAQAGVTYKAFIGTTPVGQGTGTGSNLRFAIDRTKLSAGNNAISFTATIGGCSTVPLTATANMRINGLPTLPLAVKGDTICTNSTSNPFVTITGAQDQVTYEAYLGTIFLGRGTGPAASLQFPIDRTKLAVGNNVVSFRAVINGCGTFNMTNTANVRVNTPPLTTLQLIGDTICTSGGLAPRVIVKASETAVTYTAFKGTVQLGTDTGTGSDLNIGIDRTKLTTGNNPVSFTIFINGCTPGNLSNTTNVRINTLPNVSSGVDATGPVCAGGTSTVTISNSTVDANYLVYDNLNFVGSKIATGATTSLGVNMNVVGLRTITIKAVIKGCDTVFLAANDTVRVNKGSDVNLDVNATSPICIGNTSTVTVLLSQLGVNYQVFEGTTQRSGIVTGTGGTITFNITGLAVGSHTLRVSANTAGCGAVDLVKKPVVVVNDKPLVNLVVRGDTLCTTSAADSLVTIVNAQTGVDYKAFVGSVQVGQGVGTGVNLRFTIDKSKLLVGNNTIRFTATISGCTPDSLTNTANMRVNGPPPLDLLVNGDTICSNATTNPFVTVKDAVDQVTYEAYLGTIFLGRGTGPAASLQFPIDRTKLAVGNNVVSFRAIINGCGTFTMTNTANVRVNTPPLTPLQLIGDTICTSGGVAPRVIVKASETAVTYTAFKGAVQLGTGTGTGLDLNVAIDRTKLTTGNNTVSFTIFINGCAPGNLSNTTNVRVNTLPDDKLTVKGSTVCANSPNATLTVEGTLSGVTYQAFEGTVAKGLPVVSTGTSVTLTINLGSGNANLNPAVLNHILRVESFIKGCDIVPIADTALIKINQLPDSNLVVSGGISCGGISDPTITIAGTKAGEVYQAYNKANNNPVGLATVSPGGLLTINIPALSLGIGAHIISVTSTIPGCAIVNLKDTARVIVNELPSGTLTVTGSTVCSDAVNATVTIQGSKAGENYQAFIGNDTVGVSVTSSGTSTVLQLPVAKLGVGSHIINVKSKLAGCGVVTLVDTGLVVVNKLPDSTLVVKGSVVCNNSISAKLTIENTSAGETYLAYEGNVPKGNPVKSTGGNIEIDILLGTASNQLNKSIFEHILKVESSIKNCAVIAVKDTGLIKINPLPDSNLVVNGSVNCINSQSVNVTVAGSKAGETYQAFKGLDPVGPSVISNGGLVTLSIPTVTLGLGTHVISVTSTIEGCAIVKLKNYASVIINDIPSGILTVKGSTVCSNSLNASVRIEGTKKGETYQAYRANNIAIGAPVVSNSDTTILQLPVAILGQGSHIINVSSSIGGCTTVDLGDTALVVVNKLPADSLIVSGSTVCTNSPGATLVIEKTNAGEIYQAYENSVAKGNPTLSTGGNLILTIPIGTGISELDSTVLNHILKVEASIKGCAIVTIKDTALIKINQLPDSNLTITGYIGCGGTSDAEVKVFGARKGVIYQAYKGNVKVGVPVLSNGGTTSIFIPINELGVGESIIKVSAKIPGCDTVNLTDTALVILNKDFVSNLDVIGDTVCSSDNNAFITIINTKAGETYKTLFNGDSIRVDTISPGGDFKIRIPVNSLTAGVMNTIRLQSVIPGCGVSTLANAGLVLVNTRPDVDPVLIGDTVCNNDVQAIVTIRNTKVNETYTAYLGIVPLDTIKSNAGDIILILPVSKLEEGPNTITATVSIPGCGFQDLNKSTIVIVNPLPSDTLQIIGDTVCIGAGTVNVTVKGTKKGERYQALKGPDLIGTETISTGGDLQIALPIGAAGLPVGFHKITVTSTIDGCAIVNLKDTADVLINNPVSPDLDVLGDIVCSNSDSATVQVLETNAKERYTAFLNTVRISYSILSTGGTVRLRIPVTALKPDTNIITIITSIPGCGSVPLIKTAKVILNALPDSTLKVKGDTICSEANATSAVVRILNTASKVTYTAYLNNKQIGQPVVSIGGDTLIRLPLAELAIGKNLINIEASIDGCANVALKDTATVVVNQIPSVDPDLGGSVVCSDALNATVTVKNSAIGADYEAKIGADVVGRGIGNGTDLIISLPLSTLKPDTNIVSMDVKIKGCASRTLTRSALVVLNPLPSGEVLTEGDTVCQTAGIAVLSVFGTQKKVSYQAYLLDGTAIGSAVVSTVSGSRVELTIPVSGLLSVENKLTVRAKIEACSEVRIKDTALIVVNRLPLTTRVNIDGSSMCPGEDGEVTMSGGDKDITYTVFVNGQSTPFTFRGQSPATKLIIPASYLPKDVNSVSLTATIPACSPVEAGDGTSIYVLYKHLNIMGDTLLCDSSESEYMVVPLAGALSYKWTVDQDAQIVSPFDTASSVKVKFGTQTAVVKVVPVATNTTCEISGDTMRVKIEPPVRGTGIIESKDTACLHELDSVYVSGLTGVSSYNWIWPGTDSLYRYGPTKRTKRDSVSYEEAGFVNLKVLAYSNCAGNYVDTLAKKVRVLSIPTAEANEYENLEPMRGNFRSVPLNGLGSSETSGMDTISYKWYVGNPNFGTITNPGSLMDASILPAFNVTKVYLLVTNINGYCPVKDSAVINLNYTVEIPNVFTPNGDGVHDSWDIKNINMFFPNCTVEVFNKWGSFVYSSANGYPEPWNGTRNGEDMPVATYYYIVDFKNGETPRKGSLTIIR